jgi:aminocarboxymuconate-semialdehyde decarboxylase
MNNPDAALAEMERAITALKAVGVQFFTNVNGAPLDLPRFKPLFAQMASWSGPSGCIQRGAPMSRMIVRK